MKERDLELLLVGRVRSAGGLCIKLPAELYRGIPDRMVLLPGGRIFFIELKTDTGRVSPAQVRFSTFLRSLGFNSDIIKGKKALLEFIDACVQPDLPRGG